MTEYKELKLDFEIPELIQDDINEMLEYLNNGGYVGYADVYESTIRSDINSCDLDLNEEQSRILREYYVFGGIYNNTEEN